MVIAHDMPGIPVGFPLVAGERAFSAGGIWCNLGSAPAAWNGTSTAHPVTALNLLRVEDGVLVQLGASWAWHHFCALEQGLCDVCQPTGGACPPTLGVGCSTTSTASALATQASLSRRSEINASTGDLLFPFSGPVIGSSLDRRCRVPIAAIDVAGHPGAAFAMQSVTIHPSLGDPLDRTVVRSLNAATLLAAPSFTGPAIPGLSAVGWWQALEPSVAVTAVDVPNDGRILVAARVAALPDGPWRYDYAIENLDSHESVGAFAVRRGPGATLDSPRFHAPLAHSGEVTGNAPWAFVVLGDDAGWATVPFADDPLANAVRWGTTYTFGFNSPRPPADRPATLRLFRSATLVALELPAPAAPADLDLSGAVNAADLAALLSAWGPCPTCSADLDGDGAVGAKDLITLLAAWQTADDADE
jgi:hypothetical protein